jgi:hypothetical protein
MKRQPIQIAAVVMVCLLAAAALSNPGRRTIRRMVAKVTGSPSGTMTASPDDQALAQAGLDVEQRVRARYGWTNSIVNSVVQGSIIYYDRNGAVIDQANLTVYRAYPNRLRVVLDRKGAVETVGFNGVNAWRAGTASLNAPRAREIRALLRAWPDRLFTSRDGGASYREVGPRLESSRPSRPWQAASRLARPVAYEQVEMQDVLVPAAAGLSGDRRSVTYYVNRDTATIEAARWLEPDNPLRAISDPDAPKLDVRVDFGDWRRVGPVLWPYDIVHWLGGRVDYRITVSQVQMNQPLAATIFLNPNN